MGGDTMGPPRLWTRRAAAETSDGGPLHAATGLEEGWMEGAVHRFRATPMMTSAAEACNGTEARGLRLLHYAARNQRKHCRTFCSGSSSPNTCRESSMCLDESSDEDAAPPPLGNPLQSPLPSPKPFVLLEQAIRKTVEEKPPRGRRRPRMTCE